LGEHVVLDEDGGIVPVTLTLTPEAKAAWIQFHDRIESELKVGGSLCDVRDVASKTADNACRLAAIFQVYEYGKSAVALPAFEPAARIAEWHLTEARRFFGEVVMPEENVLATKLETWIVEYCQRRGVSSVPISAIQNSGPSKLRPKVALETTIRALEELGRVRHVRGQGKAQIVEINPALLATAIIANPAIMARFAKKAVI
jgi:putative DNA primase/helicase